MLSSVLKICIINFPAIKKATFHDASVIECGGRVVLSYYSLLLHGQTWYDRYFNAVPKNKEVRNKLQAFRSLLREKPCRTKFPFAKKVQGFLSWHDYFNHLKREKGCHAFLTIQKEIEHVAGVKLLYSEWYIRSKDIQKLNVDIVIKKKKSHNGGCFNVMSGMRKRSMRTT